MSSTGIHISFPRLVPYSLTPARMCPTFPFFLLPLIKKHSLKAEPDLGPGTQQDFIGDDKTYLILSDQVSIGDRRSSRSSRTALGGLGCAWQVALSQGPTRQVG